MELAIAGSIAGTAEVVQPPQHRQQAVKVFETAQIPLGKIGFLGCHRPPPANMTVLSCCRKQRANSVPNRGGMSPPPVRLGRCRRRLATGKTEAQLSVKTR